VAVLLYSIGIFLLCFGLAAAIFFRKSRPSKAGRHDPQLFAKGILDGQIAPIPLSSETEKQLSQLDWSEKDVMVGTVRTPEQLQFCLKTGLYYAPSRLVPQQALPIRYIALHEEDLGDPPGIRRWGEVLQMETRPRSSIPVSMRPGANPQEDYCCFTVKAWSPLPHPIDIVDTFRGRPQFTSPFLLQHCTKSYQLFAISSEADYRLMLQIYDILDRHSDGAMTVRRISGSHGLVIADRCLMAVNTQGHILEKIPLSSLSRHPRAGFLRLKAAIKQ